MITKEFALRQWPGRDFRVRSHSANWRNDVPKRLAVVEVWADSVGIWVDFVTIREPEIAQVEEGLEQAAGPSAPTKKWRAAQTAVSR